MYKFILVGLLIGIATLAVPAQASKMAMPHGGQCDMKETVTLGINFNQKAKSFGDAKIIIEEQMKKVEALAKQQKVTEFVLQSQNYNIRSQPDYSGGMEAAYNFQFNGSVSYKMTSADEAIKLAEILTQQNYQVNVNSNAYRQGHCPMPVAE